jgi:hypothetical protein
MASPSLPLPVFNIVEICQEASERAGLEFRSGYSLLTARRSLELLSLEWANRGLNLWTVAWDTLDLDPLVNPTPLPVDTIDVLDVSLRQTGVGTYTDTPLHRLGSGDWALVNNKLIAGRPTQYYVNRLVAPVIHLNPALDQARFDSGLTALHYSRLRYMQPIPPGGIGVPEMPLRFINAMISGLAFQLALKSREPQARASVPLLRELYEQDFQLAADEDRERVSFFAVPDGNAYGRGC